MLACGDAHVLMQGVLLQVLAYNHLNLWKQQNAAVNAFKHSCCRESLEVFTCTPASRGCCCEGLKAMMLLGMLESNDAAVIASVQ